MNEYFLQYQSNRCALKNEVYNNSFYSYSNEVAEVAGYSEVQHTFQRIKQDINKAPYRDSTKNTCNKAGERDRRRESTVYVVYIKLIRS